MIQYRKVVDLSKKQIQECNNLINANFTENRFDTYTHVITYEEDSSILGFVGIFDNYLNQLCTNEKHRKKGIATNILKTANQYLSHPIFLFINKNQEKTEKLLKFYLKLGFTIDYENDLEYKMTTYENMI
jgi:citrate lyase synthetase